MTVFDALIASKTRVQILMRLFLDAGHQAYLRQLAREFSASPSQVRNELLQLSKAGLLVARQQGKQTLYSANAAHPMYSELRSMVHKALGMDHILESILSRLGNLELAFVMGDYAEGKDSGIIDLGLVGNIDHVNLNDLTQKAERYLERKIRTLVMTAEEYQRMRSQLEQQPIMPLWETGKGATST